MFQGPRRAAHSTRPASGFTRQLQVAAAQAPISAPHLTVFRQSNVQSVTFCVTQSVTHAVTASVTHFVVASVTQLVTLPLAQLATQSSQV